MKWWPWSRKTQPIANDNETFLKAIEATFAKAEWAEVLLNQYIQVMDVHCRKYHAAPNECDVLCGPSTLFKVLAPASKESLEVLSIVALKYWYQCFVTLRDRDQEIES